MAKVNWRERVLNIMAKTYYGEDKSESYWDSISKAEIEMIDFISKKLIRVHLSSFKKGYFKGVLDSEYGQITSEELLEK